MNSIVDGRSQRPGQVGHEHDRALEDADEQRLATGVVGVDLAGQLGDLVAGSRRAETAPPRCRRRARDTSYSTGGLLRLQLQSSRRRRTPTPPGRSTGPCPCQSVTSASSAAMCVGGQLGRRRRERPGPQHPGAHRARQLGQRRDVQPRDDLRSGPSAGATTADHRVDGGAGRARRGRPAPGPRCGPAPRRRRPAARPRAAAAPRPQPHPLKGGSALCGSSQHRQPQRVARRAGRRAAHAEQRPQEAARRARACRRSSAGPSRGPARAAPSRPGRRGCGRAARRASSAAATASSAA